jgi:hypothetical protein
VNIAEIIAVTSLAFTVFVAIFHAGSTRGKFREVQDRLGLQLNGIGAREVRHHKALVAFLVEKFTDEADRKRLANIIREG